MRDSCPSPLAGALLAGALTPSDMWNPDSAPKSSVDPASVIVTGGVSYDTSFAELWRGG